MALKQTFCGVVFALIVMNVIYFLPFSNCTNLAENISSHCDDDLSRNMIGLDWIFFGFFVALFMSCYVRIYLLLRSIEEPYSPISGSNISLIESIPTNHYSSSSLVKFRSSSACISATAFWPTPSSLASVLILALSSKEIKKSLLNVFNEIACLIASIFVTQLR